MLRTLPALLGDQMIGEISREALAPVAARTIDKDAIAPPIVQELMRIGRMQNEREPDDLLTQQRERGHAIAGLPEVLDQSELGIGIRAEQPAIHL
jgi:hypothetical protein